jgi:DNA helicase-2/ATP-dependent DNA helicase PcrA
VKDVLSVLRWAQNPRHRMAGLRVAQLVPGIGTASAKRLLDAMARADDPVAALHGFKPPPVAAADWRAWLATFDALRAGSRWPADLEQVNAWYRPQLHRLHDDAAIREADLAQLARVAGGYASRESFLAELTLDPPEATSDESGPPSRDEDYMILSTIHSAKGQEWKAVFVLNAVDGCIPSDMATGNAIEIEEERRLLYVAMTRARQHLHLLVPQRFYVTQQAEFGDKHLYGSLTRFIPPPLVHCFEAAGETAPNDFSPGPTIGVTIDAMARVRSSWT